MNCPLLSPRLLKIAELIPPCRVFLDGIRTGGYTESTKERKASSASSDEGDLGGRPDGGIGPYIVLASFVCPRAVSLAPAGQFTFSFISAGAAKIHSLRCSSSPI